MSKHTECFSEVLAIVSKDSEDLAHRMFVYAYCNSKEAIDIYDMLGGPFKY